MWQNIIVFAIIALAAGITAWRFYAKFTGKSSCCGGDCACSPSHASGPGASGSGCAGCSGAVQGASGTLKPLTGTKSGCGCAR